RLRRRTRRPRDPRARPARRRRLGRGHPASLRVPAAGDLRMSGMLLHGALIAAQVMLALAMACAAWRMLVGPRAQARVLATDALCVDAMLLMLTFGMRTGSTLYFEAAMVIALVGFVSTVALAKFLMRGEVIE